MKKALLLLAGALASGSMAMAQTIDVNPLEPAVYPDLVLVGVSPDGNYLMSSNSVYGIVVLIDRTTGEVNTSFDEDGYLQYCHGYGVPVSNNGIMVGGQLPTQDDASYFENGEWNFLPVRESDMGVNLAHGITADGSRIIGQVGRVEWGPDESKVMQQPVIWNRNADNTGYDEYIELPFPDKDIYGTTPQYVTGVSISADGKIAAGQVVSGAGFYMIPIVYKEAEDGSWSWEYVHPELLLNPDVELPENPGERPEEPDIDEFASEEALDAFAEAMDAYDEWYDSHPNLKDFMSEEDLAAYNEALQAYYEDYYNNPYPFLQDYASPEALEAFQDAEDEYYANQIPYPSLKNFLSEEELAAYNEAMEAYEDELMDWKMKYMAYEDALEEATWGAPTFEFNSVCLSANGRYLVQTDGFQDWFSGISGHTPYVFDLETGEYYILSSDNPDMYATFVANDGTVLATSPADPYSIRKAYVCVDAETADFIALEDYVKTRNTNLYEWMEDNMVHEYLKFSYDEDYNEVVDVVEDFCTGSAVATPDLKVICSWEMNQWDMEYDEEDEFAEPTYFYSYVLPMQYGLDGTKSIATNIVNVKLCAGGVIEITGEVSAIEVFDVNGRMVYSAKNPASVIETGLSKGVYVVKATTPSGNTAVGKATF